MVKNVGFCRLIEHLEPRYSLPGRKYISETALPKLYETVREHISCKLKDVQSISFTTDIWSCDATQLSLLSLTAHWVDTVTPSSFTLQSAVLQANEFCGSHTGKSIAESIEGMLVKRHEQHEKSHGRDRCVEFGVLHTLSPTGGTRRLAITEKCE